MCVVRQFPFRIGRAPDNGLALDEPGVWDCHLNLDFQKQEGFILRSAKDAITAVNDEPTNASRLRNGDRITLGSVKIQFWLAPPRQRGLQLRETSVWLILILVTAFQFFLIYHLLK